ncbi:MAG: amino acid adenylation domain-containing protein [Desulfatitalea sp.]|nr:amino acid adenylation domain-containing protein [Desulfatitalea sp.]NNK00599.1 amino acid adenylation domain-containing protein [Desulfatitalea sp.]
MFKMTTIPESSGIQDKWPLLQSPLQHREWMLWRMSNDQSHRMVSAACKLSLPLDEQTVRRRLYESLRRHPVLRLAFNALEPYALVSPDTTIPFEIHNAHSGEALAVAVARHATENANIPFVLPENGSMRAALICSDSGGMREYALLLVAHPIIADEITLFCLLEEIDANQSPEQADDTFFKWAAELDLTDGQIQLQKHLTFYRNYLQGASFQADLPTDKSRPPVFNSAGDDVEIEIPAGLLKALKDAAETESTTAEVFVMASLAAYLARISRQSDILIGVAADLRPKGFKTAAGPFENDLVLRVALEDNLSGHELIRQVDDHLKLLVQHRDLPFAALVEALQPDRDPSRTPIFQVHFAHRKKTDKDLSLPVPTGHVATDLDVTFCQGHERMTLRLSYRKDLFLRSTIEHMGGHLIQLLTELCEKPDESVNALSICTPTEYDWIMSRFGIQHDFSSQETIHSLFDVIAAKNPDAVAVSYRDVRLTYAELDRRANQLAHLLRRRGVGRDAGVGVCLERSEELIVALLAILKAGGAYIPIEPANPKERIEFVLNDANARIVLTEPALKEKLSDTSVQMLLMEPGGKAYSSEPTRAPENVTGPDGLAYVIYTSGSTGRPKGVLIEHRNVVRLFEATRKWFNSDRNDVWTMFHSVSFDFSVWEIWGALLFGGRVVIVPYLTSRSPVDFYNLVVAEQVTVLNQTPSAFRQFIQAEEECGSGDLALRLVIFGGEALEFESLRSWFERHGDQAPRLVNMYGITETCVHVTYRPVSQADLDSGIGASIIGVPIPDLSTYVVDERLQLLPPGIPGELVVGGAGLARGYHARPELTAERFVKDPFSSKEGGRLYRSGDLVRLLPTGELDYLGRIDFQVKIRGFRIETGEIEAVLRRSGLVEDVAVVPWRNRQDESLLVAYCVSDHPIDELRGAASVSLPEYMVPAYFVLVPSIPMTINGKVDRRALPDPQMHDQGAGTDFIAPEGELERIIAEIWCDVLGAEKVSVNQRFFDAGGTSLGAVQVITTLKHRLNRDIGVVALFEYPTVSSLAVHLGQSGKERPPEAVADASETVQAAGKAPIAIVGMACRFPGADNTDEFWRNLIAGKETISFFNDEELSDEIDPAERNHPAYVKAKGILNNYEQFDAGFFGISPLEAQVMDPQQRIMLELCWHALEDAGIAPGDKDRRTGVFVGMNWARYYQQNVLTNKELLAKFGGFNAALANEPDFLSTHVSFKLDLKGPSVNVFTACSTGLVAVAQACAALALGQCEQAIAGGISVSTPVKSGYLYQEGNMLSRDGHCRPFDINATGTTFNDGAGVIVLKRLDAAIADGDRIDAVIKGYAINNDGEQKASFTAPSVGGQVKVFKAALSRAGIDPQSVGFIEAHGTGTPLGDPIEVQALRQSYANDGRTEKTCALGSVKSNIGHAIHAAGIAGLIKATLAVKKNLIPPTLFFNKPNPKLELERTPFFVNRSSIQWPGPSPRRAAVTSLGVGGTNAHVVIEEYTEPAQEEEKKHDAVAGRSEIYPVLLSARSESGLERQIERYGHFFEKQASGFCLADAAFTSITGRKHFAFRAAATGRDAQDIVLRLKAKKGLLRGRAHEYRSSRIGFMFSGQGAQRVGMGQWLYEHHPAFRKVFDRGCEVVLEEEGFDIRVILFEADRRDESDLHIDQTRVAQPALFLLEYGLAQYLMARGCRPDLFIGHSIGEFTAAALSGVFAFEDAVRLVARRGALMQSMPPGRMLVVKSSAEDIRDYLGQDLCLAAVNAPGLCVLSGPAVQIEEARLRLTEKGMATTLLHTSHAFHSHMMAPIVAEFEAVVAAVPKGDLKIPIYSTKTGKLLSKEASVSTAYWASQLRMPVLFSEAVAGVSREHAGSSVAFVEVGPGTTLTTLVSHHRQLANVHAIAALPQAGADDRTHAVLSECVGKLWVNGYPVEWGKTFEAGNYKKIRLPGYAFSPDRHWLTKPAGNRTVDAVQPPSQTPNTAILQHQETQMAQEQHQKQMLLQLKSLLEDVTGYDLADMAEDVHFAEAGLDSLLLTQVATAIDQEFKIGITFRHLVESYTCLKDLSEFIAGKVPMKTQPTPQNPSTTAAPMKAQASPTGMPLTAAPIQMEGTGNSLQELVNAQLRIMQMQLQVLGGSAISLQAEGVPGVKQEPAASTARASEISKPAETEAGAEAKPKVRHTPGTRITREAYGIKLSAAQKAWIDDLMAQFQKKFAGSKAYTQKYRKIFADPRTVSGFNPEWKEIVFPIVTERSKGSKLWDIDGNEFIDTANGFGPIFFGHSPDFVTEAVKAQMDKGIETGPQSPIAGEVARLFCELTGNERCTFACSGSEAVIGALRLARTVTGRNKVVMFEGAYHGIYDEVINRPGRNFQALPAAPGIPRETTSNMIVLPWAEQESIEVIRELGSDLAAVLVEPVQSRRPEFHSPEYIRALREVTREIGAALILDEVVTGFRVHPGGIGKRFDVDADLSTYGKVIGGGYPIGIIGGKAKFMDALDGGFWQYGDASIPESGVTFFAGTFVRHPLCLAAAQAVLTKIKAEGQKLYDALEEKTGSVASEAKTFIARMKCDVTFEAFASIFYVAVPANAHWGHLLFAMMTLEGIHIQQYRPNFLTTEHSKADCAKILSAFKKSLAQLILNGLVEGDQVAAKKFLSGPGELPAGARLGKNAQGEPAYFIEDPDNKGAYLEVGKP